MFTEKAITYLWTIIGVTKPRSDQQGHDFKTDCSVGWRKAQVGEASRSSICDAFELIHTTGPLDFSSFGALVHSKYSAFVYNLKVNFSKVRRLRSH